MLACIYNKLNGDKMYRMYHGLARNTGANMSIHEQVMEISMTPWTWTCEMVHVNPYHRECLLSCVPNNDHSRATHFPHVIKAHKSSGASICFPTITKSSLKDSNTEDQTEENPQL